MHTVHILGPSLLVYNDATFTEDDFKSIQRIGDSLKKSEETKSKIGSPFGYYGMSYYPAVGSYEYHCV